MEEVKKIKITIIKSTIGAIPNHRKIMEALGLKKLNSFRIYNDNPAIRGMIFKVKHLVKVEEVK